MNLLEILGIEDKLETVPETKKCIKCGEYKENTLDNFPENTSIHKKLLRNDCRDCTNRQNRERTALGKIYPKPKDTNYKCPICGKANSDIKKIVLDHNHDTGNFRGYLCDPCNRALGALNNIATLKNAIKYLEGSESELISKG